MSVLIRSGIRYLFKHPGQVLLSIFGIALGVAVVISIDIANSSAEKAFDISMDRISGKATHFISGGTKGVPDSIYIAIKSKYKIANSAPIVETYVKDVETSITYNLLGIDPFEEAPFREFTASLSKGNNIEISSFLSKKNSVVISQETSASISKSVGDTIRIIINGEFHNLLIVGILKPDDANANSALRNLIITDISNAQELIGFENSISKIDLIISEDEAAEIEAILPDGVFINSSNSRSETANQMTSAFKTNLTSMSLLALIVGMFLIYNTMTFSVVQRRRLIGLMRSIGVTKSQISKMILIESSIIGLIGTILGVIIGIFLGVAMLNLVTQTINDLYFVMTVKEYELNPLSIVKGVLVGIMATLIATYLPIKEATNTPARNVLSRSAIEAKITSNIRKYNLLGFLAILFGVIILSLPSKNIYVSYFGIVPLIIGFTLLTPFTIKLVSKHSAPLFKKIFSSIGKMAALGIQSQMSRSMTAIAALAIAVSAAIGVGTMVNSFRGTVIDWLEFRLKADIYVSVPSNIARFNDGVFSRELAGKVAALDGVERMNYYREFKTNYQGKTYHILSAKVNTFSRETFKLSKGNNDNVWDNFENKDHIMVTETYAYKNNVTIGDTIELPTDRGIKKFPIAAVYYEYSSDMGLIFISQNTYFKYFDDRMLSGIAVFLKDGINADSLMQKIQSLAGADQKLVVRSNKELLTSSIVIFDRTFIITNVMQLLAVGVAFMGILSALTALQLERMRELSIMRAVGLTPGQLRYKVILQTGLMGFISGILALPLGNILAYVLINVINKRSFGWSLEFKFNPEIMLQALLLAIVSSILAGIYPAYKMSKTPTAYALRNE